MDQTISSIGLARTFGYMTEREVRLLQLASALHSEPKNGKQPIFVNVGSGSGTSAMAMREAAPDVYIYSVDISPGGPLGGFEGETTAFEQAGLTRPFQILGDSRQVAAAWDKDEIELLFIDDGHLEHEIRGDIAGWLPHVAYGGIVLFHDYGSEFWPAVKQVVDELLADYLYVGRVDTLAAYEVNHVRPD